MSDRPLRSEAHRPGSRREPVAPDLLARSAYLPLGASQRSRNDVRRKRQAQGRKDEDRCRSAIAGHHITPIDSPPRHRHDRTVRLGCDATKGGHQAGIRGQPSCRSPLTFTVAGHRFSPGACVGSALRRVTAARRSAAGRPSDRTAGSTSPAGARAGPRARRSCGSTGRRGPRSSRRRRGGTRRHGGGSRRRSCRSGARPVAVPTRRTRRHRTRRRLGPRAGSG